MSRTVLRANVQAFATRAVQETVALARGALDAALPQTCIACGTWLSGGRLACAACDAEITAQLAAPYCPRCGRTLPRASIHADGCARCRTEHFWNVAAVARIGQYGPAARAALLALKYSGDERCAAYFGELLAQALARCPWGAMIEALAPVPMHGLRRLQRPCDHARLLAEALGRRTHLPVLRVVRRARHVPSQTGMLSKTARFENVKGCFAPQAGWRRTLLGDWSRADVRGRTVCIVDNLLVAGATVYEVSKVLRRLGAKRIYALVVARAPAPGDPPRGETTLVEEPRGEFVEELAP